MRIGYFFRYLAYLRCRNIFLRPATLDKVQVQDISQRLAANTGNSFSDEILIQTLSPIQYQEYSVSSVGIECFISLQIQQNKQGNTDYRANVLLLNIVRRVWYGTGFLIDRKTSYICKRSILVQGGP